MNWFKLLLFFPLVVCTVHAASIELKNDLNFKVNPLRLKNGKMEMAIKFIPAEVFRGDQLASIDIEDLALDDSAEIAFVKGAFIVNRSIDHFDEKFFLDSKSIKEIYDADRVLPVVPRKYSVAVSQMGISMDFDLLLDFKDQYSSSSNRFDRFIDAVIELDESLPEAAKYQLLTQDNFTHIFNRSVTVNMFIPYGEQTLVVSYSLASAKKQSIDKINSIPFVNAYKVLTAQLKDCMMRTYKVMERK